MDQKEIWEKHTSRMEVSDIVKQYSNPALCQLDMALLINPLCKANSYHRVIEVGCESSVTNMLVSEELQKTYLDFNEDVILKVQVALDQLNNRGTLVVEDMFHMSAPDECYDVVFNSRVIEHYNSKQRTELLKEYARVMGQKGTMVIAFPNHYSFPYRSAYVLKNVLLRGGGGLGPPSSNYMTLKKKSRPLT
jgi:ubiquinone/menaquinone biosynthesis C-methylase UbiE